VRNRAEYLSEFRSDVEGFISRELVEACVRDYIELPPQPSISYRCFVDAASGVPEGDSYVIVIAHKVGDRVVIDCIREARPPFNAFEVIDTLATKANYFVRNTRNQQCALWELTLSPGVLGVLLAAKFLFFVRETISVDCREGRSS
jgi:hypothetical protein